MPKSLSIIISTLLGLLFIASGALKMMPLEYLENELLYQGLGTEVSVLFTARLIIASEFILGAWLITRVNLKKAALLSLIMLIIYSIYLTIQLVQNGNQGNCGCFGPAIVLTPAEGILKNVVMGVMSILLILRTERANTQRWHGYFLISICAVGLMLPYILYPVDLPKPITLESSPRPIPPLSLLYETPGYAPPPFEIRKGRVLVAFVSLKCGRCKTATTKLEWMKRQHPDWPIFLIANGKMEEWDAFAEETKLREIPFHIFNAGDQLVKITGLAFPTIYILEDGELMADLAYYHIDEENLAPLLDSE